MTDTPLSDAIKRLSMLCHTCQKDRAWHEANPNTQHSFNDGSIPVSETFGKKLMDGSRTPPGSGGVTQVVESPWPFDPVLRQALIDKGVLTPQDLRDAEEKIRTVTSQFGGVGI